ncbi:MAG: deoxyribose-phosphate aldolase [Bacteroidales bacterium]|nr:deoxyribose-phosphate aldolase [Bacteroidales bacterium]
MKEIFKKYAYNLSEDYISSEINKIKGQLSANKTVENLKLAFSLIDLTTLNSTDSHKKVQILTQKVSDFSKNFPNSPNVAAICVYPPFVKTIKTNLTDSKVKIASVGGGFPSSQTFLSIKKEECKLAGNDGADDIDIVLSLGHFLTEDYQTAFDEISQIKKSIGTAHLKVILETGALKDYELIYKASVLSMEAGADFIKTSTGKMQPAATPEAIFIMASTIKSFYEKTGKKIGIKPAGGMTISEDALLYVFIVSQILGQEWLTPELFRLGASKLANNLLTDINKLENNDTTTIDYF